MAHPLSASNRYGLFAYFGLNFIILILATNIKTKLRESHTPANRRSARRERISDRFPGILSKTHIRQSQTFLPTGGGIVETGYASRQPYSGAGNRAGGRPPRARRSKNSARLLRRMKATTSLSPSENFSKSSLYRKILCRSYENRRRGWSPCGSRLSSEIVVAARAPHIEKKVRRPAFTALVRIWSPYSRVAARRCLGCHGVRFWVALRLIHITNISNLILKSKNFPP